MDRCLGCRACETACPSGVPFGQLLEATRGQIERRVRRPAARRLLGRLVLGVFPDRRRLAGVLALLRLYQRLGLQSAVRAAGLLRPFPRLDALERLLPAANGRRGGALPRDLAPAGGGGRGTVAVLAGCVQSVLFPEVNEATVGLLVRAGYRVRVPPGQGCCGALHLHWGDRAGGRARALANVAALADADWIVTNAAGCGAAMREYGHLLPDEPLAAAVAGRVRDVSEILAEHPPGPLGPVPLRVTYHDACHLAHGQRVRESPRALLRAIPELELVELPESDLCCGSAGVYSVMEPRIAGALLERKLDRIEETGAAVVAAGNPGCLLQLRMGLARRRSPVRALHPVELLARSVLGRRP
jgi:glycolate oxidase iron-sulfur subunit